MKKLITFTLLVSMMFWTMACAESDVSPQTTTSPGPTEIETTTESDLAEVPIDVRVITPEGATTFAMLKMIYEQPALMEHVTLDYESINSTDLLASEIISEKVDFAIIPTNLAIKLYNRGIPYQFVSINTHGNLYMVTSEDIATWEELVGKDIYMIGQGLVPDLVFRSLLKANGLDPETDVNLIYLAGATEVAPTFISGKSSITIMPEPVLSTLKVKGVDYKVLFDLQDEYDKISGFEGGFPQAGLVVRNTIAESYPELVEAFTQALDASANWLIENPDQAATYSESLELGIPAPVFKNSIPGMNIRHEDAFENRAKLEQFFELLSADSPEAIGGKMPDENFYFRAK